MLYDAVGAGRPGFCAAEETAVFWRAMLAKASRIEEPLAAGAAGLFCIEAIRPAGGLPGGVVVGSVWSNTVR